MEYQAQKTEFQCVGQEKAFAIWWKSSQELRKWNGTGMDFFNPALDNIIHIDGDSHFLTNFSLALSSLGLGLSVCALLFLILTAYLFPGWRKNFKNQLLIQFMFSRFCYTCVRYFHDIVVVYGLCIGHDCVIYLDVLSMIYTEAALVSWMFVFTKYMYNSLVTVFSMSPPCLWRISLSTWVIPFIFSVIFFMVNQSQDGKDLIFFFIYLALFKWPVLIVNATLLIIILQSIKKENVNKTNNYKSKKRLVIVMTVLIWSFCFQQVFLDVYKLLYIFFKLKKYFLVLFNIITLYHCSFAIFFWILGNSDTRKLWSNYRFFNRKHTANNFVHLNSNQTIHL